LNIECIHDQTHIANNSLESLHQMFGGFLEYANWVK